MIAPILIKPLILFQFIFFEASFSFHHCIIPFDSIANASSGKKNKLLYSWKNGLYYSRLFF